MTALSVVAGDANRACTMENLDVELKIMLEYVARWVLQNKTIWQNVAEHVREQRQ